MSAARTHTAKSETYSSESIVHELQKGNNQEAARELNRDLHSSKDFNAVYKKANEQIDKYNQSHDTKLPHLELVDEKGKAATGKDDAKGIKIDHTTYGTDTVRNNKTVDDKTGNQTVRSGDSAKTLDSKGNEVSTDPEGKTTTKYAEANKPTDNDIGKVASETKDGKGGRVLVGDSGATKTIDMNGKETTDYPNGDRKVSRPDGSGCTIHKDNGVTQIHSWATGNGKQDKNYDVTIKPDGTYEKHGKRGWGDWEYTDKGKDYKYQPDEN